MIALATIILSALVSLSVPALAQAAGAPAEYGHRLVGLYEVLMNDYEVCTIWATDADDHVRAGKARDVARGLAAETDTPGDARFERWNERARSWAVRWREELMTPHLGTLCAPTQAPTDDSNT